MNRGLAKNLLSILWEEKKNVNNKIAIEMSIYLYKINNHNIF